MKKMKQYKYIVLIFLILVATFYLYKFKPVSIRKECVAINTKSALKWKTAHPGSTMDDFIKNYNASFAKCLKLGGL